MLDKRCRHKMRQTSDFYLFRKHGYYYYAFFPKQNVTRSTKCPSLPDAEQKAWELLTEIELLQNVQLYKPFTDNPKRQRELTRALTYLPKDRPLTPSLIARMQKKMLEEGLSGKSINSYVYVLRRAYTREFPHWEPLSHEAVYRSCFPIASLYHIFQKCSSRLHYLAFFAMTTGVRVGEIKKCSVIEENGRAYIAIDGTKTRNAVRRVPALPETISCMEHLEKGFRSSAFHESVVEVGKLIGYGEDYIEREHIVFHSWRKVYKTLLEGAGVPNSFVEYLLGHSQTRTVNQLYFIGDKADDSEVYPKVIEALRRLV